MGDPEKPSETPEMSNSWHSTQPHATRSGEPEDASAGLPKIIKFELLAKCGEEIWIENAGQIYRLRRTRQGKLILTK